MIESIKDTNRQEHAKYIKIPMPTTIGQQT